MDYGDDGMNLYDLNDALENIAQRWGVTSENFITEEAYDEWLDDLTHLVAAKLDEEY